MAFTGKLLCVCRPNLFLSRLIESIFDGSFESISAFDRAPNEVIGNSNIGRKFLEFQGLLAFVTKMVLYLLKNFDFKKRWANNPWVSSFDLGF